MKRLSIILIAALANILPATAQTPADSLAGFVKNINTFNYLHPQEKVYLHFDNTGYFMGENIWFKAYVVNSCTMRPTDMSRVLHVELLTPEGRILTSQKLKVEHGQAHGHLPLTEVLHAGFYEVRAYTRMMLNWDKELVFSRVFPIFDAPQEENEKMYANPTITKFPGRYQVPYQRDKKLSFNSLNCPFFPEGGDMVEGIPSAIYFQATDRQGQPAHVKGKVINSLGQEVAAFTDTHQGMGKFVLIPQAGEQYRAKVEHNGKNYTFDLPQARPYGYTLTLKENGQQETLTVQLARKATSEAHAVALSVMGRGKINYFRPVEWDKQGYATLNIPKEQLMSGVNQLTLFDTEGRIHAERLTFIRPTNGILISCRTERPQYGPCEIVEMNFLVSDRNYQPTETTFSLSVRDADTDTPHNRTATQAEANLLLGSDLKGFIQDIDYYFESNDDRHRAALDLLMGTQGFRRYDWQQMTTPNTFQPKHFIEEGITINGELRSTYRNRIKDSVEISVTLWSSNGQVKRSTALTDSLGRFAFVAEDFNGRWNMNIQTKENGKRKEMSVQLDKEFAPKGRSLYPTESLLFRTTEERNPFTKPIVELSLDTLSVDEQSNNWENLLPTVDVEAKQRWKQWNFRRWQNMVYDMEEEFLRTDVTGEEYMEHLTEWLHDTNAFYDKVSNTYKGKKVIFRYKWDFRKFAHATRDFSSLSIDEVEAVAISDKPICVMRARAEDPASLSNYGMYDSDSQSLIARSKESYAVITVFVKDKFFNQMGKERLGERLSKLQGYSTERQFYMPDYSETLLPDEKDYRRTLYWNPNVTTDANGEATVSFYNTPTCRHLRISAATVTADGLMGNLEQ